MGKKYIESTKLIDKSALYGPAEALELTVKTAKANFDETIELHVRLGVDPRHADQQVRGAIVLPNGTGKSVKVLVFAKGDKAKEAEAAGADFVGAEELVQKIQSENWFDYDVVVATPDMMGVVGRIGRVLGPKGLMPNPKSGTVTFDVAKAIAEIKAEYIQYDENFVLSAIAPETIVAVVAQKTKLNTKFEKENVLYFEKISKPGRPINPI